MAYASIGRRILAMILDSMIILIPAWILHMTVPVVGGVFALFFYYAVFESSALKATIGKHLMGIEVVSLTGDRITLRAALIRLVLKILSMAMFFIGHFIALFTQRKQAVHDLVAETVVVYGRCEIPITDAWISQARAVFDPKAWG